MHRERFCIQGNDPSARSVHRGTTERNETRRAAPHGPPQRDGASQKPWEKRDSADRRPARDGERKPWENRGGSARSCAAAPVVPA